MFADVLASSSDIEKNRQSIINAIGEYYQSLEGKNRCIGELPCAQRNILLLGRTRSGKTTFKCMLSNPQYVPNELTLISETRSPTCESITIPHANLTLTLVDTVGLFDRSQYVRERLNSDEFSLIIDFCKRININEFNLICFCVSFEAGINNQDIEALYQLVEYFGHSLCTNLCLIVTRCESKTEIQRIRLQQEFSNDTHFQGIVHFFGQGIYFSGALNRDDYNYANESLIAQFVNICAYRQKIIDLLRNTTTVFAIKVHCTHPPAESISKSSASEITERQLNKRQSNCKNNCCLDCRKFCVVL